MKIDRIDVFLYAIGCCGNEKGTLVQIDDDFCYFQDMYGNELTIANSDWEKLIDEMKEKQQVSELFDQNLSLTDREKNQILFYLERNLFKRNEQ